MLTLILKHILYEKCINLFFDTCTLRLTPVSDSFGYAKFYKGSCNDDGSPRLMMEYAGHTILTPYTIELRMDLACVHGSGVTQLLCEALEYEFFSQTGIKPKINPLDIP